MGHISGWATLDNPYRINSLCINVAWISNPHHWRATEFLRTTGLIQFLAARLQPEEAEGERPYPTGILKRGENQKPFPRRVADLKNSQRKQSTLLIVQAQQGSSKLCYVNDQHVRNLEHIPDLVWCRTAERATHENQSFLPQYLGVHGHRLERFGQHGQIPGPDTASATKPQAREPHIFPRQIMLES